MTVSPNAQLLLPLYACVFPRVGYVMLLGAGPDVYVPLFTSIECFEVFNSSFEVRMEPLELGDVRELRDFLIAPPTPKGQTFDGLRIAIDTIDKAPGSIRGFLVDEVIESCELALSDDGLQGT